MEIGDWTRYKPPCFRVRTSLSRRRSLSPHAFCALIEMREAYTPTDVIAAGLGVVTGTLNSGKGPPRTWFGRVSIFLRFDWCVCECLFFF